MKCDNCQNKINTGDRFFTAPPIKFNGEDAPALLLAGLDYKQGLTKLLCEKCAKDQGETPNAKLGILKEKHENFGRYEVEKIV